MPHAYDPDLRLSVVRQFQLGESATDISLEIGIARKTVYNYLRRFPDIDNSYKNCGSKSGVLCNQEREDIVFANVEDPFRSSIK